MGLGAAFKALGASAAGLAAAGALKTYVTDRFLPANTPQRDLLSPVLASAAAYWAAGMLKGVGSDVKEAAQVGALFPILQVAASKAGLGAMLGTERVIMLPAPASQPQSVGAALMARLSAQLQDPDDESGEY